MALFGNKESCPVCGQSVSGLFKVKIKNNVALCQSCGSKVKMDSSMLPFQSVDDIKAHLEYRNENQRKFRVFTVSQEVKAGDLFFRVDDSQKLWYYDLKNAINPALFRFDEIIDYDLSEDGEMITKGGVGKAVAGGLMFGGVGAIVGGATAKKKTQNVVKHLKLHITLANKYTKSLTVEFIPALTECKSGSITYNLYRKDADNVIAMLDNMCRQVEADQNIQSTPSVPVSGADEIMKYKQLLDCGAITQEEFDAKKKQLLGL